ncbi:hypothetical protein Q8F55_001356 [Vanrija albida]|uniref:Fibronectin type-III domain-containing protein n=1 Tax=Vanrija albida TaxID=181172 RepID=A0ABR3QGA2_9TREE
MALPLFGVCVAAAAAGLMGLSSPTMVSAQSSITSGYNITFNWTLNDLDAPIRFLPDSESLSPPKGFLWNTTFAGSPWSSYYPGQNGVGDSVHVATNDPYATSSASDNAVLALTPRVQVEFVGTGIYINGWVNVTDDDWTYAPISFQVDSQVTDYHQAPPRPVLVSAVNLPWGYHNCTLFLNRGTIHLDNITLVTGLANTAWDIDIVDSDIVDAVLSNGTMTTAFLYTGSWNTSTTIGYIPSANATANNSTANNNATKKGAGHVARQAAAQSPVDPNATNITIQTSKAYPEIVGVPGAELVIPFPANTSFVAINGSTGPKHGQFRLHWSTPPPSTQNDQVFSMWSPWSNPAVLFQGPLDPLVHYNLTIVVSNDTDTDDGVISINSVTFYPYFSEAAANIHWDNDGPPKGPIAGGVVGGVVLIAIIAGAAYYFGRRRRNTREAKAPIEQAQAEKLGSVDGSKVDLGSSPTSSQGSQPPSPVDARSPPALVTNAPPQLLPIHEYEPPLSAGGAGVTTRVSPWATQSPGTDEVPYVVAKAETLAYLDSHGLSSPVTQAASPVASSLPSASSKSTAPRPPPVRTRPVEQEQDAGAVDLEPELVPPVYNPEWAQARSTVPTSTTTAPASGLLEDPPSPVATLPTALETDTHEADEGTAGPGPSSS